MRRLTALLLYRVKASLFASTALLISCFANAEKDPYFAIVTELSPPNQTLENGIVAGTSTELVKQIIAQAKLQGDYQLYPWARAYKLASSHKNTLIYSMAKTPDRANLFHWIGPVAMFHLGFVTNAYRNDVTVNSLEDAKKYRLAVQRGDIAADKLKSYGFDYVLTADIKRSYQLLIANKVDLVLDDPRYLSTMAESLNLPKEHFKFLYAVDGLSVSGYLAASISTPEPLVARLKEAFAEIQKKANYQQVLLSVPTQ